MDEHEDLLRLTMMHCLIKTCTFIELGSQHLVATDFFIPHDAQPAELAEYLRMGHRPLVWADPQETAQRSGYPVTIMHLKKGKSNNGTDGSPNQTLGGKPAPQAAHPMIWIINDSSLQELRNNARSSKFPSLLLIPSEVLIKDSVTDDSKLEQLIAAPGGYEKYRVNELQASEKLRALMQANSFEPLTGVAEQSGEKKLVTKLQNMLDIQIEDDCKCSPSSLCTALYTDDMMCSRTPVARCHAAHASWDGLLLDPLAGEPNERES